MRSEVRQIALLAHKDRIDRWKFLGDAKDDLSNLRHRLFKARKACLCLPSISDALCGKNLIPLRWRGGWRPHL